jgi:hypothetical protein
VEKSWASSLGVEEFTCEQQLRSKGQTIPEKTSEDVKLV